MSVVISSYQTGRPSKVEVATAIKHLRSSGAFTAHPCGRILETASLARADDERITSCRRGPRPVAGFPHSVLGTKCTGHGAGACARSGDAPPGATRWKERASTHASVESGFSLMDRRSVRLQADLDRVDAGRVLSPVFPESRGGLYGETPSTAVVSGSAPSMQAQAHRHAPRHSRRPRCRT